MADKGFGVKEINLIGASGTPTIESPNNINLNAVNVAISTNTTVGGTATFGGNVDIADTIYHTGDSNTKIRFPANDTITFHTSGNEHFRIDSSGNIGQAVTPSGWASAQAGDFYAYQIGTGFAAFGRGSGDLDRGGISVNYYNTAAAQKYIGNGHAGRIYFEDGSIVFSNAAQNSSGANAAMTLNEKLKITADGDIAIGGCASNTFNNYQTLTIGGARAVDGAGIDLERSDGNIYGRFFADANGVQIGAPQSGDYIRFECQANEKMKITSSDTTINGTTDGVLNLNTTDSRGSFIRFQQAGNTRCWVGSGHGMGMGDDDDLGLMATDKIRFNSQGSEKLIIDNNEVRHGHSNIIGGGLDSVRINNGAAYRGTVLRGTGGSGGMANYDEYCFLFNRMGTDGNIITFNAQGSQEGAISVSGSSVSYNGGVLTRWSQLVGISTDVKSDRPTIYQGTVMSNLDEMCEWTDEENMQLNKTQVSTASGDRNVAGVFWAWDDDDDTYVNDFYIAQTGDYIIRVGAATTVTRGDLLESAGDGTAKPQSDDIVRSKTIAKVTSGTAHTTYPDGSKTYPCVLMAS